MAMPTEEELKTALAEAGRMREQGEDPHFIAKSLLNLNYQNEQLMQVLKLTDKFLRTGMNVTDHQKLRKAVENARRSIERTGAIEGQQFGL
jgi:hypothetical protein